MTHTEFKTALKKLEPQLEASKSFGSPESWTNLHLAAALLGLLVIQLPLSLEWAPDPYKAVFLPDEHNETNIDTSIYYVIPCDQMYS